MRPLYLPFISRQLLFRFPVIYLSVHILFVIILLAITCFFFFYIYISISTPLFLSSFVRPPDCLFAATKSFPCPLNVLYLFPGVLSLRLSATRVLLVARLPFLQFLFPPRGTARVNTFSSPLSRVIDQQGVLRATGRFADSASVITMFMAIIRFRRNY